MRRKKHIALAAAALSLALLLAGCGQKESVPEPDFDEIYLDPVSMDAELVNIVDESVALSGMPALDTTLSPTPSGTKTKTNSKATIDYSNTSDGYVMVQYTASTSARIKVLIMGPNTNTADTRYQYDLPTQQWVTFPLADGDGSYTVKVMRESSPNSGSYATDLDVSFKVSLTDEFAPFIRSNQYVNYSEEISPNTIAKAAELTQGLDDPLAKVRVIYEYVVNNLRYDTDRADKVVKGELVGYLPVLDSVLAEGKGICFDYAALMSGMLRSQGVPCKLITGYVNTGAFHAWINVWTEEDGWVDGAIYFDGTTWHRMDPTYASNGKSSASIMKYIGNGDNYKVKHAY